LIEITQPSEANLILTFW